MSTAIGISGYGRIGRLILRATVEHPSLDVKAVNSTVAPDYMAYMLKYDSLHGRFNHEVSATDNSIIIDGKEISVVSDRNPENIPWGDLGVDYVIDATGKFRSIEKASLHLKSGAKKVVITAPSPDAPMFVMGVNTDKYDPSMNIVSNASCTTNCLAPLVKVLHENFGVESGLMTTIHSATASQKIVDSKSLKEWRDGRSATYNIIPTTTGAAKAVGKVLPELNGKLTGMSLRVPTLDVSAVDLTVNLKTPASHADICAAMKRASENEFKDILGYSDEPLVSSDYIHDPRASIFDAQASMCLTDTFAKIVSWYDNEWGYCKMVLKLVEHMAAVDAKA
jgi:glyceraldehyde 3-phosphate dehydrogenase